jgi:hypothetical protein
LLFGGCDERRVSHKVSKPKLTTDSVSDFLKPYFIKILFPYYLSGTLISPLTKKRDFMRRYILILIVAISSPLLHAQSRGQRKAYVQLGFQHSITTEHK